MIKDRLGEEEGREGKGGSQSFCMNERVVFRVCEEVNPEKLEF